MADVLGLGESSIDYVHVLPSLPDATTSKLPIHSHFSSCGGQVATTMAACASLGMRASYLGPVGTDDNGRRVLAELQWKGVDVSRALVREANTRFAVILVDARSGHRTVLWHRDERLRLDPSEMRPELFDQARALHVDAVDEAASIAAAKLARARGLIVTSDIDCPTALTAELVANVSVPIFAEPALQALTGEKDVERALRSLRSMQPGLVLVTLGDRGAAALDGDRYIESAAARVNAVDTTGAGDVFRAGAIYGLLNGWPAPELLRFANAAAARSCTRRGAITAVPTLSEVNAVLA